MIIFKPQISNGGDGNFDKYGKTLQSTNPQSDIQYGHASRVGCQ